MTVRRVVAEGLCLSLPLAGVAVGWGLDNGPLMLMGAIGFLVALWGVEIGVPTLRYRRRVGRPENVNAPRALARPGARDTEVTRG